MAEHGHFNSRAYFHHYTDFIMTTMASQITSLTIVCSIFYSDADQRKHQSSASLAFVWGIHRGPVNSPHKWPVTRKMFPFDDVIMTVLCIILPNSRPISDRYRKIFRHWALDFLSTYFLALASILRQWMLATGLFS